MNVIINIFAVIGAFTVFTSILAILVMVFGSSLDTDIEYTDEDIIYLDKGDEEND